MKFTSPLFSAVSGSIGGTTYSHNKGGMYARVRNIPPDAQSEAQLVWRPIWKNLTLEWAALTEPQRESWRTYALNVPRTDRLGQVKAISGHQHFLRSNAARYAFITPSTVIPLAPSLFNVGSTPIIEIVSVTFYAPNDISIKINMPAGHPKSSPVADDYLLFYISMPESPTHTYRRNALRYWYNYPFSFSIAPATEIDWGQSGWFDYQTLQASWIRCVCSCADGRLSAPATVRFLPTLP